MCRELRYIGHRSSGSRRAVANAIANASSLASRWQISSGESTRARARARTARPRFYIAVLRGFPFDRFTTRGHVSKVPTSISDREVQRRGQDETRGFSHSEILCVVLAGNARKAVSHTSQQQWRNAGGRSRSEAKTQLPGWIYI